MSASVCSFQFYLSLNNKRLWEQISNPNATRSDGNRWLRLVQPANPWNAMGPTADQIQYIPWVTEIPTFRCPSDPGVGLPALGRTNYGACLGDSIWLIERWRLRQRNDVSKHKGHATSCSRLLPRSFQVTADDSKFRDTLDGLSNTIAMGEMITALQDGDKRANGIATNGGNASPFGLAALRNNPSICYDNGYVDPERPQFWLPMWQQRNRRNFGRGHRWADALPIMSAVVTILASKPRSVWPAQCLGNNPGGNGFKSAPGWCSRLDGRWSGCLHDRFRRSGQRTRP